MAYRVRQALIISLGVAVVTCTAGFLGLSPYQVLLASAQSTDESGEKPGGPPPLVVDEGAPLLLDDSVEEKDPADAPHGPVADNGACFVCHINYEEEPLAAGHAKQNVSCMKCHGKSYDHRNDEDNITPPDVMFPREEIAAKCQKCHETHDASAARVIARWQSRGLAQTDPKQLVCTDCHGRHRLKNRTVWWDKKTRELIIREEDQPTKTAPDLTKPPLP
ncbi:MAG: cytochrome c3 family protein [Planctomycetales bacterium]